MTLFHFIAAICFPFRLRIPNLFRVNERLFWIISDFFLMEKEDSSFLTSLFMNFLIYNPDNLWFTSSGLCYHFSSKFPIPFCFKINKKCIRSSHRISSNTEMQLPFTCITIQYYEIETHQGIYFSLQISSVIFLSILPNSCIKKFIYPQQYGDQNTQHGDVQSSRREFPLKTRQTWCKWKSSSALHHFGIAKLSIIISVASSAAETDRNTKFKCFCHWWLPNKGQFIYSRPPRHPERWAHKRTERYDASSVEN